VDLIWLPASWSAPEFLVELGFEGQRVQHDAGGEEGVGTDPGHRARLFAPVCDELTHTATCEVMALTEFDWSNGFATVRFVTGTATL
jgi:hypothetical protein